MSGKHKIIGLLAAILIAQYASISFSRVVQSTVGEWPKTWPSELEPYRLQAKSYGVSHGISEMVHEIRFERREDFERAWSHILSLKSDGAPLILETSPSDYPVSGSTAGTGVRILCPPFEPGSMLVGTDGKQLHFGPPWPESIKSPTGKVPEYVIADWEAMTWVPWREKQERAVRHRARVDIMLIVDGKIVDLNRIPLPPDTPIVDRRFEKQRESNDSK